MFKVFDVYHDHVQLDDKRLHRSDFLLTQTEWLGFWESCRRIYTGEQRSSKAEIVKGRLTELDEIISEMEDVIEEVYKELDKL